ncbi:HNH endonuclease, partial [Novosphingobium acidiphilum]|uniref:HNH endonuclease n=1 Tax=Novosphingobium acidiphilum TaxID=505248 RepID=UPI00146FA526
MKAYDGKCAVTSCAIEPLLEAAHIHPYLGPKTNHVTNGMLLRADIHTLFDLGLLAIAADHRLLGGVDKFGVLNHRASQAGTPERCLPQCPAG